MAKACQLFSGSSGNSIFISGGNAKFLVDAGVSAKRIGEALSSIGENPQDLTAVFVTHEHIDHIKGIRVFAKKYNIPVFAQTDVLDKMRDGGDVNEYISAEAISENMELSGVEILPFKLSHDSVACVGYRFNLPGGRSVSVCTDTGFVTDGAHSALAGSDLVFLESNHETKMLENGFYPYQLKKRIMSDCPGMPYTWRRWAIVPTCSRPRPMWASTPISPRCMRSRRTILPMKPLPPF